MANEATNLVGTWATVQAAASTADGAFSAGARTTITAALTGTEDDYALLDFEAVLSSGTPTENGSLNIYRRSKADSTNESPAPAGSFKQEYVGSMTMDNTASSKYYLYGVPNTDKNATYYVENDDGANTLTIELKARGRTYTPA